jgi:hypothetical protein
MKLHPPPSRIFEEVSADLFSHGGYHFLAYDDRLSGWTTVTAWRKDPTSHDLIKTIAREFLNLGVPVKFHSNGEPNLIPASFALFYSAGACHSYLQPRTTHRATASLNLQSNP